MSQKLLFFWQRVGKTVFLSMIIDVLKAITKNVNHI